MKVKIERAKTEDIPSLLKLWKEMMDYHKKLDKKDFELKRDAKKIMNKYFIENINSKYSVVLKAVANKKIIGYLMGRIDRLPPVYKNREYGAISDAIVALAYRKKGVMKKLVKEAALFFKKKGIKELRLRVYLKNVNAMNTWSKIGFKETDKLMFMDTK